MALSSPLLATQSSCDSVDVNVVFTEASAMARIGQLEIQIQEMVELRKEQVNVAAKAEGALKVALEARDLHRHQHSSEEEEESDVLAEDELEKVTATSFARKLVFKILLFMVGHLPWSMIVCLSQPWIFLADVVAEKIKKKKYKEVEEEEEKVDTKKEDLSWRQEDTEDKGYAISGDWRQKGKLAALFKDFAREEKEARRRQEKEARVVALVKDKLRLPQLLAFGGPFLNIFIVTSFVAPCIVTILHISISKKIVSCAHALVSYWVGLAVVAGLRISTKVFHGPHAKQTYQLDATLMSLFGIYIVRRGRSAEWVYGVVSIAPAAVFAIVHAWFDRTQFPVSCGMVNETMHDCTVMQKPQDISEMASYAIPKLAAVYGAVKAFAAMMIKLDPEAKADLMVFRDWKKKRRQPKQKHSLLEA